MFIPKSLEGRHKLYEEMGSVCSSNSFEKATLADESIEGWSTGVNDSTFKDDWELDTSWFSLFVNWSKKQSKAQKALYALGAVACVIIFIAAVVVFREWGLTTSSKSAVGGSLTRSPTLPSGSEPSEKPPQLPWTTQTPTSKPLPVDLFTRQPTMSHSPDTPTTTESTTGPLPEFLSPATIFAPVSQPLPLTDQLSPPPIASPSHDPTTRSPSGHPTFHPASSPSARPAPNPNSDPTAKLTVGPSASPIDVIPPSYVVGNLIVEKLGLLLSEGLDARLVAMTGEKVEYDFGDRSRDRFHDQPDAGATFPDPRTEENPGGWIYVSNSEVDDRKGGVGALTFDRNGNILDYCYSRGPI